MLLIVCPLFYRLEETERKSGGHKKAPATLHAVSIWFVYCYIQMGATQ